ncbi:hypothetical protein C2E25_07470 [Geothermobacter hydrogeniphilus]|uniref:RNA-binding protein KhpB N-terminal domain-containing protein n=1 Tax=Geothermobacter hydrogeniphilus TaxID=1969733 RepID=A0A2K2HAQ2_9BACT|nr:Jag N-terminal domain-containing protein [Geothermobacter hydrogeniphilus]PNU20395.1 hypothetical protein C2E25_07470 [Geothermobacter hydrogeniphilus]
MVQELLHFQVSATGLAEAVDRGIQHFNCNRSDLEVDILQPPRQGLFGLFGRKNAVVRLRVINRVQAGRLILEKLLSLIGMDARVESSIPARTLNIISDQSAIIIGRHGQTIDSLQTVLNGLLDSALPGGGRLVVDCDDYRQRRIAALQGLARKLVRQARESGGTAISESLPGDQCHILQQLLTRMPDITVWTRGQGHLKQMVVGLKA